MIALMLSEQEVQGYLDNQIFLAAVNAPQTCVLAGSPFAIEQLEQRLSHDGVITRRVVASHAFFHTPLLGPVGKQLREYLSTLQLNAPQIPYVSNVTGTWISTEQSTDPLLADMYAEMQQRQQWLVFLDSCGVGEVLTEQLRTLLLQCPPTDRENEEMRFYP